MAAADLTEILEQALVLALMCSLPALAASLLAGFGTSLLQLYTRLSEPAVTQVPRILAVLLAVLAAAPWISGRVTRFAERVWSLIDGVGI
jgi:flagellar biosynthetic protein FliQ